MSFKLIKWSAVSFLSFPGLFKFFFLFPSLSFFLFVSLNDKELPIDYQFS